MMNRLPECAHCEYNACSPYLVCSLHPEGQISVCLDYSHLPVENNPIWHPVGAGYYNGELILQPEGEWTDQARLELLDYHPIFTGRCPVCEMPISESEIRRIHWDCQHCGWKDDSV